MADEGVTHDTLALALLTAALSRNTSHLSYRQHQCQTVPVNKIGFDNIVKPDFVPLLFDCLCL